MLFTPIIIISMIRFDLTLIVIANLIKSTNNNPENVVRQRSIDKPCRMLVSGVYKIKGVSDIITDCTEQGEIVPGVDVTLSIWCSKKTICS